MDKKNYYRVNWITRTTKPTLSGRILTERGYSRTFDTEAEAVKKAREVAKKPASCCIRVAKMQMWETPDPAPNGTLHVSILDFIEWRAS